MGVGHVRWAGMWVGGQHGRQGYTSNHLPTTGPTRFHQSASHQLASHQPAQRGGPSTWSQHVGPATACYSVSPRPRHPTPPGPGPAHAVSVADHGPRQHRVVEGARPAQGWDGGAVKFRWRGGGRPQGGGGGAQGRWGREGGGGRGREGLRAADYLLLTVYLRSTFMTL